MLVSFAAIGYGEATTNAFKIFLLYVEKVYELPFALDNLMC